MIFDRLKLLLSKNKATILYIAITFLIPIPSLFWLPKGETLAHGPIYPWPHLSELIEIASAHSFNWLGDIPNYDISSSLFYLYASFLSLIGKSSHTGQSLFFYFGFVSCILGMFSLVRKITKNNFASLIAGIFYILLPTVFSGSPIEAINLKVILFYISTPFLFSLLINIIDQSNNSKYLLILTFFSFFICSAAYSSLQYFALHLILIASYLVYRISLLKNRRRLKSLLLKGISIFSIILLTNLYWLLPLLFNIQDAYSVRSEIGFSAAHDQNMIQHTGAKILNILRILPYPYQVDSQNWIGHYYKTIPTMVIFAFIMLAILPSFKTKSRKTITIFSTLLFLLLVFLEKGTGPPFGWLGSIIFTASPYMTRLFRNLIYFNSLLVFPLSILVGLGVSEILSVSKQLPRKIKHVPHAIIIFLLIIYGYPLIYPGPIKIKLPDAPAQSVKVPNYYLDVAKYISEDKADFRITTIPAGTGSSLSSAYRWNNLYVGGPFMSVFTVKPSTTYTSLSGSRNNSCFNITNYLKTNATTSQLWNNCLKFSNVRYISFHKDADWKTFEENIGDTEKENINTFFNNPPNTQLVIDNKINLSRVDDDLFLPHFYIPKSTIYSQASLNNLFEISDLDIMSKIYLVDNELLNTNNPKDTEMLTESSKIFLEGRTINDKIFSSLATNNDPINYPTVKHNPNSRMWKAARLKEIFIEWQLRNKPKELLEKKLFYANKRIAEIKKWGQNSESLKMYQQSVKEAIDLLSKLEEQSALEESLNIKNNLDRNDRERNFEELHNMIDNIIPDININKREYTFIVPENGDYQLLTQSDDPLANYHIKNFNKDVHIENNEYRFEIIFENLPNLLDSTNWGEKQLLPSNDSSEVYLEKNNKIYREVDNINPNTWYKISGEYQLSGEDVTLAVRQAGNGFTDADDENYKEIANISLIPEKNKFELFMKADSKLQETRLYLYSNENAQIKFSTLKLEPVWLPKTFLIKEKTQPNKVIPNIKFTKINPTKYKVTVFNAKDPYDLVFNEGFSKAWKVYLVNSDKNKNAWYLLGKTLESISKMFVGGNDNCQEEVGNYFSGKIIENECKATFLKPLTAEVWGQKAIAESSHYFINGYANAWRIDPNDVGKMESYELIVEFWPQRLLYLGLFISAITPLCYLGIYALKIIIKNAFKKND